MRVRNYYKKTCCEVTDITDAGVALNILSETYNFYNILSDSTIEEHYMNSLNVLVF